MKNRTHANLFLGNSGSVRIRDFSDIAFGCEQLVEALDHLLGDFLGEQQSCNAGAPDSVRMHAMDNKDFIPLSFPASRPHHSKQRYAPIVGPESRVTPALLGSSESDPNSVVLCAPMGKR